MTSILANQDLAAKPVNADVSAETNDQTQLKEACQQFEAILVNQMVSELHSKGLKSDLMGDEKGMMSSQSSESDTYNQMLDEQISNAISQQQGIGLADMLYQQFTGTSPEEGTP